MGKEANDENTLFRTSGAVTMTWAIDLPEGIRRWVGEDAWSSLGGLLRPQVIKGVQFV